MTKAEATEFVQLLISEVKVSQSLNLLHGEGPDEMVEGWLSNRLSDLESLHVYVTLSKE